jgi:hypothetical protein
LEMMSLVTRLLPQLQANNPLMLLLSEEATNVSCAVFD